MASAIQDLIARKNYAKAIEAIAAELKRRPKEPRLLLQQADVLILAGRVREAIPVLLKLADQHAHDGYTAKAIACLKRIEKLEGGRQDVEDRLAKLVQEKSQPPSRPAPSSSSTPEFGFEEFDPNAEISFEPGPQAKLEEPVIQIEETPVVTVDNSPASALELEGMDSIEIEAPPPPTSATQAARSFLTTPLFEGFEQQELAAIIRGLQFKSAEPGDVLVGEGAPGDSMFIIVSGTAKAWVRDRKGHMVKIKELSEGEFFGEVSVLTGKPRTATITAANEVEMLELDKATLDGIVTKYPRVQQVLRDYQKKRAEEAVEAILRTKN
jgi:hypothetical protein